MAMEMVLPADVMVVVVVIPQAMDGGNGRDHVACSRVVDTH